MPNGKFDCLRAPLAGAALLGAAVAPVHAQDFDLDPILVEGVSLGDNPVAYGATGSAVTVVTGEELERRQVRNGAEAIRSLPGVSVSRTGALGGLTQVRLRGGEANHTLVLIDGMEANDTGDGEFYFQNLDVMDIERIEVIRGPQSGLYGSKAMSGVINVVTRSRRGPLQVKARTETGSFATVNSAVNVSGGSDFAWGSLSLSNQQTNGFNISDFGGETDETRLKTFGFKGGIRPFEPLTLDVVVRGSDNLAGSDGEGPGNGPNGDLTRTFDTLDFNTEDILLAGAGAKLELFGGHWVQEFRGDLNDTVREFRSPAFYSRNEGYSQRQQYLNTLKFDTPGFAQGRHRLTGLIEREDEEFTPVTQDNITRARKTDSLAGDYNGEFFGILGLQAAVRRDDFDVFGTYDTWRTAGSLKLPDTPFRVHGSAGTGVKAPTMFEQFGELPLFGFVPNPDLVAEESFGWDAGVETTLANGRAVVDVTWFETDLENKIGDNPSIVLGDPTLINLPGISERKGLEVAARLQVTHALEVGAAYTNLDAVDSAGLLEIRRPEHAGRVDVNYSFAGGRGNLHAAAIYNGEMDDLTFRQALPFDRVRVMLDDYLLVNLAGSYEIREGVELFGRVENMFDEDYEEIYGYGTAPVAAFGGIRVTLGEDGAIR